MADKTIKLAKDILNTGQPLWSLGIIELMSRNLEAQGREEVNKLLEFGWVLLHIYTLRYREEGVWRERPMAILGRTKKTKKDLPF